MRFLTFFLLMTSHSLFSQVVATTTDGKKVLLESNKTWKYIDNSNSDIICNLPADYVEPKSEEQLYKILKSVGGSTDELKAFVAVDNDCSITEVKLISFSEQMGSGIYSVCVKGIKKKYRKTGTVFSKYNENLL